MDHFVNYDHIGWRKAFALASFLFVLNRLDAQRRLPVATIHIEAFDPFGGVIRASKIRLLTPDRKHEFADRGDEVIADVPYGQYIVAVSDTGGAVAERDITVNAKEMWVKVGLPFPAGERAWPGGDLAVNGSINPPPTNPKDWWVRIDGVFLDARREAPILNTGQFSITGLEMGTYLVEVFEGAKLRHVRTIEIDTNTPNKHLDISVSEPQR